MQDKTAKAKIKKAVNSKLPNESEPVKAYIEDLVFTTYRANKGDYYTYRNDTEALEDALEIDLDFELAEVLKEAREQTAQSSANRK